MYFESYISEHCTCCQTPDWNITVPLLCNNSCQFIQASLLISPTRVFASSCPNLTITGTTPESSGQHLRMWTWYFIRQCQTFHAAETQNLSSRCFWNFEMFSVCVWTQCQWISLLLLTTAIYFDRGIKTVSTFVSEISLLLWTIFCALPKLQG